MCNARSEIFSIHILLLQQELLLMRRELNSYPKGVRAFYFNVFVFSLPNSSDLEQNIN